MAKRKPEEVINDWCSYHLDEIASRWPASGHMHEGAKFGQNGIVYAGDGIVAALAQAGYKIVPA